MKELIKKLCKQIERENNIKILFAIENGSRAWRMSSKDSDYDVRFVFYRDLKEYLTLNPEKDVINASFDKEGKKVPAKGALIDVSGFDIFKFCRLLSDSNPTTIEWLMSDIIYYGKQPKSFKDYAKNNSNPLKLYFHYKSMCKNNYLKYLKSKAEVTYKKYLYSFRGLINAKWVAHRNNLPLIDFTKAVSKSDDIIPNYIISKIQDMIKIKSQGKEKDKINNITKMDNYIESFLKDNTKAPINQKPKNVGKLNKEIQKILLKS